NVKRMVHSQVWLKVDFRNYLPVFITVLIPGKEGISRNEIGSVPEDILTVATNKKQWVRVLRTEAWHYYNKEFYKRRLYEALIEEKKKKLGPRILNANLFGPNFTTDPSKAFIDTERIYHPKWELNN
uniref:Uncharacterized protein n=1 Tax=Strongyloides stercoralis TaxID=6248 RepID=A0AAF5CYQ8_STRER